LVLFPMTDAMGPYGAGYPVGFIHDHVRQIAADERTPFLDLLPAFSSYKDPTSLWVSPFDAHPNAMANARAAQEILNAFSPAWRRSRSTSQSRSNVLRGRQDDAARRDAEDDQRVDVVRAEQQIEIGAGEGAHARLCHHQISGGRRKPGVKRAAVALKELLM